MAEFSKYLNDLLEAEGGFVNHPDDPGGATNKGITFLNWAKHGYDVDGDGDIDVRDLQLIDENDAARFYKPLFWDAMWGDKLKSQDTAAIMVDHGINAGTGRAVKMAQYILNRDFGKNLKIDGAMGPNTANAINSVNQGRFYNKFRDLREDYYLFRANMLDGISQSTQDFIRSLKVSPSERMKVFIKGWLNRLDNHFKKKTSSDILSSPQ